MTNLKLPSGQKVDYEYDPTTDALRVVLRSSARTTTKTRLPHRPGVTVEREVDSQRIVAIELTDVQAWVLEGVVASLVAEAAASPVPPQVKTRPAAGAATEAAEEPLGKTRPAAGAAVEAAEEPLRKTPPATGAATEAAEEPLGKTPPAAGAAVEAAEEPLGKTRPAAGAAVEAAEEPPPARATAATAAPAIAGPADSAPEPTADSAPETTPAEPGSFADFDLDPRLLSAVAAQGFSAPTEVQRRAIPALIDGKDVVGLSQTGSGKTLAFLLPALSRMLATPSATHPPRLLVVTPTRELAQQVAAEAEALAKGTDLRVTTIFGGRDMQRQTRALRKGTDVIVATPGRLLDHLDRGNAKLGTVEVLVLDEADRMLDMGFIDDIRDIVRSVPPERQTLMFGATMPAEIELLSVDFQRSPTVIEVARRKPPESIQQVLFPVGRHLKSLLLIHLLESDPSLTTVMVFVDTKRESDVLARQLREAGVPAALMHGDRSQKDREKALRSLRERKVRVLVATNVAARGLDIEDVSHVVNYDVPRTVDEYVHRIGRTARADASGSAFTLVSPGDDAMVMRIESALETTLPRRFADGFDYDVPTPSWAKPSARDVSVSLTKARNAADVSRRTRFKR